MAKKSVPAHSKHSIKTLVEKNLASLLITLYPGMEVKKFRKRIKKAGKILVKGIKAKEVRSSDTFQEDKLLQGNE